MNKLTKRLDELLGRVLLWVWCCITFSRPSMVRDYGTTDGGTEDRLFILGFVLICGVTIQTFIYEWFSWWYIFLYISLGLFLCAKDEIAAAKYRREAAIQKERESSWQPYNGEKYSGKVNIELIDGAMIWNVDSSQLEKHSGHIKKWMPKSVIR